MVSTINDIEEFNRLIKEKMLVVDFSAVWCGPCQKIKPFFETLPVKFPNCQFATVDVDEQQELAQLCNIQCMPTFQIYSEGNKIDEVSGASEEMLLQKITTFYDTLE